MIICDFDDFKLFGNISEKKKSFKFNSFGSTINNIEVFKYTQFTVSKSVLCLLVD